MLMRYLSTVNPLLKEKTSNKSFNIRHSHSISIINWELPKFLQTTLNYKTIDFLIDPSFVLNDESHIQQRSSRNIETSICSSIKRIIMTTFDQLFRRKSLEHENLCCGEQPRQPQEPQKPEVHTVPALSTTAPAWSAIAIVNLQIQTVSLRDFRGKYLIMLFYPYDFTFLCPTEMIQFSDRIEEFLDIGCDVVAISTDSQYTHLAWIITPRKQGGLGEMKIAVLSDKNQQISRAYGVLDEKEGIALKGLFVIDKTQIIRHISLSEMSLTRSVDETLRIVQACQFVDKFGGTCPVGPREALPCAEREPNFFAST